MTSRKNLTPEVRRSNIRGYTNGKREFLIRSKRYPHLAACATSYEDGSIVTDVCSFNAYANRNYSIPNSTYHMLEKTKKYFFFMVYAILLGLAWWYYQTIKSRILVYMITIVIVDICMLKFSLPRYLWTNITKKKRGWKKESKGLHGAQHMVFYAFDKLHAVPTIEQAKEESIFDKNCGYCKMTDGFELLTCLLIMGLVPLKYGMIPFLAIVVVDLFVMYYNTKHGIRKYLCFFAVSKPTDKELEIVISALQLWYDMETGEDEKLKQRCEEFYF